MSITGDCTELEPSDMEITRDTVLLTEWRGTEHVRTSLPSHSPCAPLSVILSESNCALEQMMKKWHLKEIKKKGLVCQSKRIRKWCMSSYWLVSALVIFVYPFCDKACSNKCQFDKQPSGVSLKLTLMTSIPVCLDHILHSTITTDQMLHTVVLNLIFGSAKMKRKKITGHQ